MVAHDNTSVISGDLTVRFHPDAERERAALEPAERVAVTNVIEKLRAIGLGLAYPHSSSVRGSKIRELRPRAGRSRTRVFYGRVGDALVIAAVGPEAKVDPQGFDRAVQAAQKRLAQIVPEEPRQQRQKRRAAGRRGRR